MEGSKLTVEVVEADEIKIERSPGGSKIEPYVVLAIEGQQIETKEAKTTDNPIWEECFTFDIKNG